MVVMRAAMLALYSRGPGPTGPCLLAYSLRSKLPFAMASVIASAVAARLVSQNRKSFNYISFGALVRS